MPLGVVREDLQELAAPISGFGLEGLREPFVERGPIKLGDRRVCHLADEEMLEAHGAGAAALTILEDEALAFERVERGGARLR